MWITDWLQENWDAVQAAPWAFLTGMLMAATAGFVFGRMFYSERIATLTSRIQARDEKIAELNGLADTEENDDGQRYYLLGYLQSRYSREHPAATDRMKIGLDLPPEEWMNEQLQSLGEKWRVKNVRGNKCDFYEI